MADKLSAPEAKAKLLAAGCTDAQLGVIEKKGINIPGLWSLD